MSVTPIKLLILTIPNVIALLTALVTKDAMDALSAALSLSTPAREVFHLFLVLLVVFVMYKVASAKRSRK